MDSPHYNSCWNSSIPGWWRNFREGFSILSSGNVGRWPWTWEPLAASNRCEGMPFVKVWQAETTRSGNSKPKLAIEAVEVWKVWKGLSHDSCEVVYIPSVIFWIFQMWIACALSSQYSPYKLHIQHDVLVIMARLDPPKNQLAMTQELHGDGKKRRSSILPKNIWPMGNLLRKLQSLPLAQLSEKWSSIIPSQLFFRQVVLRGMDLIPWPASVSGIPSFPMVFGWWWD